MSHRGQACPSLVALMRQTRVMYPGATLLSGQVGHYATPAVEGMNYGMTCETFICLPSIPSF